MDAQELANKTYPVPDIVGTTEGIDIAPSLREGFIKGFEACQETLSNKYVLSVDDIKTIVHTAYRQGFSDHGSYPETLDKILEAFENKRIQ